MTTPLFKRLLPQADKAGFGFLMGEAKVVAERYGPEKVVSRDMLGSFVRHGLTQEEAEATRYSKCKYLPLRLNTNLFLCSVAGSDAIRALCSI